MKNRRGFSVNIWLCSAVTSTPFWRVLVVDDNTDAADSVAILLEAAGHEVHVSYSAHDALEAAVKYQPDMVLLDIGYRKWTDMKLQSVYVRYLN